MKTRLIGAMMCGLALAARVIPVLGADAPAIERQITRLEGESNEAYGANDLPKYFSYYADDVELIFDDQRTTLADYRRMWTQTIKTEPLVSATVSDLRIHVEPSGQTAIASYQLEVKTKHPGGKVSDEHAFETDIWSNSHGAWKIIHVHYAIFPTKK